MPIPAMYPYPVRRPGFVPAATWQGQPGADELQLEGTYTNDVGLPASLVFHTKNATDANLCLPTAALVTDLSADLLIAHVRMSGMISGTVPGSKEYQDAIQGTGVLNEKWFQTPAGDVKVVGIIPLSDTQTKLQFQKGTGAIRDVIAGNDELASYSWAPSTQLLVIAGAVRKQFPTYIQDPDTGKFLTQAQMDDIAAFILTLQPWV